MLHRPGFLKFSSSRSLTSARNNGVRNGQREGFPANNMFFEDKWCTNSRRLTDGSKMYIGVSGYKPVLDSLADRLVLIPGGANGC